MPKDPKKEREVILARVRALLTRTTANGCTEAEAKAAANQVDRLMALYEIDLTEATVQDQEVMRLDIKLDAHPVRFAAPRIGTFTDTKVWVERGFISFLGLDIDTRIAEYLMLTFQRAIDRESRNWSAFNADMAMMDTVGQERMLTSFSAGMAVRLGERLTLLKSKRDFEQKATGFDLVVAKGALVDQAFESLGIVLEREKGGKSIRDTNAYNAGRAAADKVAINQGVAQSGTPGAGRIIR